MSDATGAPVEILQSLFRETALLNLRLRSMAEAVHEHGPLTAALRSVLIELHASGPRTVPDLARERPVARQYMLKIVGHLRDLGWVEAIENARHRRSYLVALTPNGRSEVEQILARERNLLGGLPWAVPAGDLDTAVRVLRDVRDVIAHAEGHLVRAKAGDR